MKTRTTTLTLPLTVVALLLPAVSQAGEYPFTNETILDSDDASNGAKPQLADLNGDGHEDVLLVGYYHLQWYENGGNFGEPMQERMVDPELEPDDAAVADVDGDGDLDIVASGDGLRWYENVENAAAFKAHVISDDDGVRGNIDVGDIDGDGDIDVVIADYWADENHWYANPGDPTEDWGGVKVIPSDMYDAIDVLVADFDGDGKDDVLAASEDYFSLLRYQDGPWAEDVLDVGTGITSLRAVDIDGDGDLDVLRGERLRAVIMRNLGDGLFGEEEIEDSGNMIASYQMDMGDVDGDGDDDLVVVMNDYDQAIHYYPNEDGSWGEPQVIREQITGSTGMGVADVDCDGDADVMAHGTLSGGVSWGVLLMTNETLEGDPQCAIAGDDDDDDDDDGGADDGGDDGSADDGGTGDGGDDGGSDDGGDDDDDNDDEGEGDGTGGAMGADDGDDGAAGFCSVGTRSGLPVGALLMLVLLGGRRRRTV